MLLFLMNWDTKRLDKVMREWKKTDDYKAFIKFRKELAKH